MNNIKRLFLDIETCPNIVSSWRIGYKINLTPDNIIEERRIICASWKWEGNKKVYNGSWDKNQDDKKLLIELVKNLNEADEIVYQNGDRFDLPWIKTRALYYDIPMYPVYKTYDTLKKMKAHLYLNSNKLDYAQKFLGGKGKLETGGFDLWKKVHLDDNRTALKKMMKYCDRDVIELENLFNKIKTYVPHNTHVGAFMGQGRGSCVHCGSTDVKLSKTRLTAAGTIRRQMRCTSCGSYYTISDQEFKKLG